MSVSKAIAQAWTDPDYKLRLLRDPNAALAEAGIEVPSGTTVKVIEDTTDTQHLVLPVAPGDVDEVAMDELEKIAAGYGTEGALRGRMTGHC